MKDGFIYFLFLLVFLNFITGGMVNSERHDKMMNEIQKLEYKVDSIQIKCDSLQNILKYNYDPNRS